MPTIESPSLPTVVAEVDPVYQSLRVQPRPWDWRTANTNGGGGHYRIRMVTGLTTTIAAGGAILSLRWNEPALSFLLLRLLVTGTISTAFGTGQENSVDLFRLNNYAGADSGGTAITVGADGRKRTSGMVPTNINDLRVATTVALTAGTATQETNPTSFCALPLANTVGLSATGVLYDMQAAYEHPFVLNQREGFRVALSQTQGATGVVRWTFVMDWAEVPVLD